jgi:hypothetical protein
MSRFSGLTPDDAARLNEELYSKMTDIYYGGAPGCENSTIWQETAYLVEDLWDQFPYLPRW